MGQVEPLPRGNHHFDPDSGLQDLAGEGRAGQDVFEIIQNQQHLFVAQVG